MAHFVSRFKSEGERERVHTKALLKRAFLVQKRQKRTNACQLIFPLLIILLLFLIQQLVDSFISDNFDSLGDVVHPSVIPPFLSMHVDVDDKCEFGNQLQRSNVAKLLVAGSNAALLGAYGDSYSSGGILNELSRTNFTGSLNFNLANPEAIEHSNLGFRSLNYTRYDSIRHEQFLLPLRPSVPGSQGTLTFCRKQSALSPLSVQIIDSEETLVDHLYSSFREPEENNYAGAVYFEEVDVARKTFRFQVATNSSRSLFSDVGTIINLVSSALYRYAYGTSDFDEIVYHGYRAPPTTGSDFTFDLITLMGPYMYIFILSLMSPIIMCAIVYDKEMHLRAIMKQMGLKTNVYWLQQYLFGFMMYFISVAIMWILAVILGFTYWIDNNFFILFFTIFFWGNVLVAFSFFLSTFFNSSRGATVVGYIFVFGAGILTSNLVANFYNNDDTNEAIIFLISLVPHFNLFRALNSLAISVSNDATGMTWSEIADSDVDMLQSWIFMWGQWAVLMGLTWYFENAMVNRRGYLFFMKKSKEEVEEENTSNDLDVVNLDVIPTSTRSSGRNDDSEITLTMDSSVTPDAIQERQRVIKNPHHYAVSIVDLQKTYPGLAGAPPKKAVNNLSMGISEKVCMGFLGPNGAGKTTTISILGGLFGATSGRAVINSLSIDEHASMEIIHQDMGVCPQHDHLWGDLTGAEHLMFYGQIKGLKGKELQKHVQKALEEVNLADAGSKLSKEYSGGMRRRLSVACALIGDPKIVLMDEPSTGLDPYSRRKLWDVILDRKKKCTILLTTHSMEECEKLCDRVAIMSEGQLKAVGTVADLKKRFGKGFKVSIISPSDPAAVARADGFIKEIIPKAVLLNTLAGVSHYEVSSEDMQLDYVFEQFLTRKSDYDITDFGVCNTTLEEVFFHVCFGDGIIPDQNAL